MELPSLSDLFFITIFVIPGFVSFSLFKRISKWDATLTETEALFYSLFFSIVIYACFVNIPSNSIQIETVEQDLLRNTNLLELVIITIILGTLPSYIISKTIRKDVLSDDCWELSFKNASKNGSWIIVYTNDGEEYLGKLHYNSGSTQPRELTIREPSKIIRNKEGEYETMEWGEEILFQEKDIKRVVFISEV